MNMINSSRGQSYQHPDEERYTDQKLASEDDEKEDEALVLRLSRRPQRREATVRRLSTKHMQTPLCLIKSQMAQSDEYAYQALRQKGINCKPHGVR